jgi:RecA/RadA recombinase/intein/homing endonuclease
MADDKKAPSIPRGKDLQSLSTAINKALGANISQVASGMSEAVDNTYLYSTGILSLDKYFGVGGVLGGRIMNIWGWEGCLTGDSLITDSDSGLDIRIDDIVNGHNDVFNVPSTNCYSDDNNQATIAPRRVLVRYNAGNKQCIKLSTEHGASVTASLKHPFLVCGKGWTEIKDISPGDYIARPKKIYISGHNKYKPEFMKLVGYLLGDGCLTEESVRISAYSDAVVDDVKRLIKTLYPDLSVKRCATKKRTYSISMNNSTKKGGNKLLNDLREIGVFGSKNLNKYIPYDLMQADDESIKHLLAGLIMSDGHVAYSKARLQYASTSQDLAQQVKFLLLRLGVASSIQVRHDTRKSTYLTLYTVNVDTVSSLNVLSDLELVGHRATRLNRHTSKTARKSMYTLNPSSHDKWMPVNVWWDKVESASMVGEQPVYNLSVEDTESMIANDIIVHNTGKTLTSLSIGGCIQRSKFTPCVGNPDGDGRVAFLDAEGTYNAGMARSVGIDPEKLLLFQSTPERILSGEDYFDIMKILIQNGIEFIIVDSLPALVPSSRMNATIGQGQKASGAQLVAEGLQQITPLLNGFKRSVVWLINQKRAKPMVMFGPTEDHTGGNAIKFFESYSLEVKKRGDIIKKVKSVSGQFEEQRIGVTVEARLHKNKTASIPVDVIQYDVYFKTVEDDTGAKYTAGVDVYKDVVQVALDAGVITQASSWFKYKDLKGNGMAELIDVIRHSDPQVLADIRNEVLGRK